MGWEEFELLCFNDEKTTDISMDIDHEERYDSSRRRQLVK